MQLIAKQLNQMKKDNVYKLGQKVFQNDGVSFVAFKEKENRFMSTVYNGSSDHLGNRVNIKILNYKLESTCTCKKSKQGNVCEHIVAVYLKINEQFKNEVVSIQEEQDKYLNLFNDFYGLSEIDHRQKIELVVKIVQKNNLFNIVLAVKINNKAFVVSNIRKFIDDVANRKVLQFGKNHRLSSYYFNENDLQFITELKVITEYYYELTKKTTYRELPVSESVLIKLIKYFEKRHIDFENRILKVTLEDIEYKLKLELKDDAIELEFNKLYDKYQPYGKLNRIFIYHDLLIINSKQNAFNIQPLKEALNDGKKTISLPRNALNKTLEQVITPINKNNNITLDPAINFKQVNATFEPVIKVIRNIENDIETIVEFNYGGYVYNIDGKPQFTEQVITNRERSKEQKILDLLFELPHTFLPTNKNEPAKIIYDQNDSKYDLLYEILPILKGKAQVIISPEIADLKSNINDSNLNFKIKASDKINFFEYDYNFTALDAREIRAILKEQKTNKKYYINKNNQFIDLKNKKLLNQLTIIEQMQSYKNKNQAIPLYKALYWHQIAKDVFTKYQVDTALDVAIKNLNKQVSLENQSNLNAKLRDYQIKGVEYLKRLDNMNLNGILADEMGLGKTIQIISLLLEKKEKNNLIVTPKALLLNWKREIEQFAPHLSINVISKGKQQRLRQIEQTENFDVNITSYAMIRQDIEAYQECNFNYIIIDEAQYIKNPKALNTQAIKLLNSEHKVALSGTPVENKLMELWSIFDFLMPEYLLKESDFKRYYFNPISEGQEDRLAQLKRQVDPFILKRTKKNVLDELPEKIETPIYVELNSEQKDLYAKYVATYQQEINAFDDINSNKIQVLAMLTRLRQLANHPKMFIKYYQGESAKVEIIKELVEELTANNRKILIFSQFTSMLMILRDELRKNGIKISYLDGKTTAEQRQALIDDFNTSDTEVFLISLKAGGYGLNLTSASAVIHTDPWWNKSVERQAEDRVHRIGQKDSVNVYKIITTNTIEEKIFELQNQKDDLIDAILDKQNVSISNINKSELMNLFTQVKE